MTAWIEVQQQLLDQTAKVSGGSDDAMRRISGFGANYVGIAGDWWQLFAAPAGAPGGANPSPVDPEPMRTAFIERYRQLFTPAFVLAAAAPDRAPGNAATMRRWHAAAQRFGQQVAAVAGDAFRRFCAALAASDSALPPVTSLRDLHELWIECGEAAYAAAASGDEFADALAELLAAFVELLAEQRRPRA